MLHFSVSRPPSKRHGSGRCSAPHPLDTQTPARDVLTFPGAAASLPELRFPGHFPLQRRRIFSRRRPWKASSCLAFIPFRWAAAGSLQCHFLSLVSKGELGRTPTFLRPWSEFRPRRESFYNTSLFPGCVTHTLCCQVLPLRLSSYTPGNLHARG